MLWPADYHMHTPLCHHAIGEPSEYAASAVAFGLTEIGFSDHSPMSTDNFDEWRMNTVHLAEYVEKVSKARRDFPQLSIKLGLEVDYLPGQEDWIRELATMHPWDYFIGSVHYVSESWAIDSPNQLSEWRKHDPYEVWSIYFEWLTMAANSGLFDIIGHADLPKKFKVYPDRDCTSLFDTFLQAAANKNVAIEINTAGLRKDCREMYPSPQIVRMAKTKGVALAFGSDAHAPNEVGMNFTEAIQLARTSGYTEYCRFTRRKREMVKI